MATETKARTEEPTADNTATPPPPAPPAFAPGQQSTSRKPQQPVDGKPYYGYLFNGDKTTTPLLDALLRAIGKYIATEIGDKNHRVLDKGKLAAFYREVGGNYDELFVNAPDKSISYIWQALGVQHTLQPNGNDFTEPSIPALTPRGFVRWESLQILLGPEEHVPFIQFAVRNWALKHPDTGEPFPVDLPKEAFPRVCDPQIDAWHKDCAKRLRSEAAPQPEKAPQATSPDPRVHFAHVRPSNPSRHGPAMDYFERASEHIPFVHMPSRHAAPGPHHSQSPHKRPVESSSSSSPDEHARRRRSFSDYPYPAHEKVHSGDHLDPRRPAPPVRRHSQPKHYSSSSETDSDAPVGPRARVHRPVRPPAASVRVFPPEASTAPPVVHIPARTHRAELRQDDPRRRSLPSGSFGIRQKLSSFLPGSGDRTRSNSRSDRENDSRPNSARTRPEHPSSRLGRGRSHETYSSEDSDSDASPKHRSRRDREREKARERELEEARERRSRKEKAYLRPDINRRTSSAADIERRPRDWDARDRYREHDRNRDHRGRDHRDPRRNLTSDERERRSWRDRDRDRERGGSPVVVGVGGRKYPTESLKPTWA
ncbi:hypothetical protein BJ170DRAFT_424474 [Xylariales sp. AK1849]|nr:hypothetical protein BJ170DRAFT_424474 [Xylariales sp. AK1849]